MTPPLAKMLSIMSRTYLQYIGEALKPLELSSNAFPIIMQLDHESDQSINELSKNTRVNKALISKSAHQLIDKKYVMMSCDEASHRQRYKLNLTRKGRKLVPIFKKLTTDYENHILQPLKKTERQEFLIFLEKIYTWHVK